MNEIDILIISNKLDFTTDYVCLELRKRNAKYFRVNRDEFINYKILFDCSKKQLYIKTNRQEICIEEGILKAIYYRAPIYLRDIYVPNIPKEEQLYRTQWTAFIRNLIFFEDIIWVNNPVSTFKSENKLLQLKYASTLGFLYPKTIVTNTEDVDVQNSQYYIIKSLDTAVLRIDDMEAFVYSNAVTGCEIKSSNLSLAPVMIQDYIYPKVDIRVTVIGNIAYTVQILKDKKGVDGDWRIEKDNVEFLPFVLPKDIENKCIELVKSLGISFGAIDLIESNGSFYFIEINPTGEWAWLVDTAKLRIYSGICDYLEGKQ